jgi:hypothetical protein
MFALYFLLSIVAVAAVVQWFIENDRRETSEPTTGILRMRVPADSDQSKNVESVALTRASRSRGGVALPGARGNAKAGPLERGRGNP